MWCEGEVGSWMLIVDILLGGASPTNWGWRCVITAKLSGSEMQVIRR